MKLYPKRKHAMSKQVCEMVKVTEWMSSVCHVSLLYMQ